MVGQQDAAGHAGTHQPLHVALHGIVVQPGAQSGFPPGLIAFIEQGLHAFDEGLGVERLVLDLVAFFGSRFAHGMPPLE